MAKDAFVPHPDNVHGGSRAPQTIERKELKIVPDGLYGNYKIQWAKGGGTVPARLQGQFTSVMLAQRAIDVYQSAQ